MPWDSEEIGGAVFRSLHRYYTVYRKCAFSPTLDGDRRATWPELYRINM